jgi:hypothetical protein
MAVVAVFCFGFIAGGGRERQQLETERRRLIDEVYELSVRESRIAAEEKRHLKCGGDLQVRTGK